MSENEKIEATQTSPDNAVPESNQQENEVTQDESKESTPVTPASATEGGRETSNKILYVGNLPKSASEEQISELFSVSKPIKSIKLLNDKNKLGFNYAFIEFDDNQEADMALSTLNGKLLNNCEIRVNWAYQSATIASSSTPEDPTYNLFVGDLSSEVNDEALKKAFNKFDSFKEAHVMWDMQTSRSRGYGFVTFSKQEDAELALQTMNGAWLGGRAIRCNWAAHIQVNNRNSDYHLKNNNRYNQRQYRPYNGRNYNSYHSNQYSNNGLQHIAAPGLILPELNLSNGSLPLGSQQLLSSPPNGLNGNAQQTGNIVMSPQ